MNNTLAFCTNLFGNIKPDIQKRLQAVIDNPTHETWDDAHCIIISSKRFKTLWQAVIEIDPTFQRSAGYDMETNTTLWKRIPTKETIIKAIQNTVFKTELN
jgi:hypothetical protein